MEYNIRNFETNENKNIVTLSESLLMLNDLRKKRISLKKSPKFCTVKNVRSKNNFIGSKSMIWSNISEKDNESVKNYLFHTCKPRTFGTIGCLSFCITIN